MSTDLTPYHGKRAYVIGPWNPDGLTQISRVLDELTPTHLLHESKFGAQRAARGWGWFWAKTKPLEVSVDPTFIATIRADYVLACYVDMDTPRPELRAVRDAHKAGIPVLRLRTSGAVEVYEP